MPNRDGTGPQGTGPKNPNCPNNPQPRRDGSGMGRGRNKRPVRGPQRPTSK